MSKVDKEFVLRRTPCKFCSDKKEIKNDTELISEAFEYVGGLLCFSLLDFYYYLLETNKLNDTSPTKEDFRIFSETLEIILSVHEKDTLKETVLSKIGKIKGFKSNTEQKQVLLETLGYCSILETNEHRGFLKHYTNFASAPKKTHNSDWRYPVDFWLGKDGINKVAFKFWFGEYVDLEKFWK